MIRVALFVLLMTALALNGGAAHAWLARGAGVAPTIAGTLMTDGAGTLMTDGNVNLMTAAAMGISPQGLLPSDRDDSANWQMAGLLSLGGIPNRTTQCGATISPIGGGSDDTANIDAAITACTAGDYVNLGVGTFTIAEGHYALINKGITLRGQGPGVTILSRATGPGSWSNQSACSSSGAWGATLGCSNPGNSPSPEVILSPLGEFVSNPLTPCALTADGAKGATSVTVTSGCAGNFSAGQEVLLDQVSGAIWQTDIEHPGEQIWASPDWHVIYHIHNPLISGDDCGALPVNSTNCGVINQFTFNPDRMISEIKRVVLVSGTTIIFDSPLTISYYTSLSANLSTWATPMLQQAGIENLTVQNSDNNGVEWDECAYCWAQKVELTHWLGRGFEMQGCFRCQLEEDYVHDGVWCVPGSGGYNIALDYSTTEALVENSISRACNKVEVARAAGAGSVIAYNYMDDGYIAGSGGWVEIGLNGSHLVGSHNMLFEGNWGFNADSDQTHGASIIQTYFRNQITGIRETFTGEDGVVHDDTNGGLCNGATSGPLRIMSPHIYAWWWSDVGNVLGTPNCTTSWNLNGVYGGSPGTPAIFMWGWDDEDSGYTGDPNLLAVYPAVGPNCPSASNCATVHSNDWIVTASSVTAWDRTKTGSGFTLSNGNNTATITATTGSDEQAYSTTSFATTTQKPYWEETCLTGSANEGHGIASAYLNAGDYLGKNSTSLAFWGTGITDLNGNSIGSWSGCSAGDTVGIMEDTTQNPALIYIRDYHAGAWGANWNATTEAQPTAGGYSVGSSMSGGVRLYAALNAKNNNEGGMICGNAACGAGGGTGLPTGAVWLDAAASSIFTQTPPASFKSSLYLTGTPTWWPNGYPWPWVTPEDAPATPVQSGPSGCGGTCSGLPAKARWDAGTPFTQP